MNLVVGDDQGVLSAIIEVFPNPLSKPLQKISWSVSRRVDWGISRKIDRSVSRRVVIVAVVKRISFPEMI